jgi:uncharacterized integral membrane protein (TIGR00698 family)
VSTLRPLLPGVLLACAITAVAMLAAQLGGLGRFGLSPLTLAIIAGVILGNAVPGLTAGNRQPGLRFVQKTLLRAGVALYGFNLSIQQVAQVGARGIWVDLLVVCSTLLVGWIVGRYLLGLDRDTVLLTSAGSAFCGAAAVVATVPELGMNEDEGVDKTATAVATVVFFGTLAMVVYPLLYTWMEGAHPYFGIYIGSTVHEVAQVVAVGNIIGHGVVGTAVIVKMIRVMLLIPFMLVISTFLRGSRSASEKGGISIPWFALAFVAAAAINSLPMMPQELAGALRYIAVLLLAAAMAALGLDSTLARLRQTGPRSFVLGLILFIHLIVDGALINHWLA